MGTFSKVSIPQMLPKTFLSFPLKEAVADTAAASMNRSAHPHLTLINSQGPQSTREHALSATVNLVKLKLQSVINSAPLYAIRFH